MKFLSNIDLSNAAKIINHPAPSGDSDLVTKGFVSDAIDKAIAGFDFQKDVIAVQKDDTLEAGQSPSIGDRYIITDSSSLHTSFGDIEGLENNDIVEYGEDGFYVAYDVSVMGDGILLYSQQDSSYFKYVEEEWSFGGLTVISAGNGLRNNDGTFSVRLNNKDISLDTEGNVEIVDKSVTKDKLNSNVAGDGLTQDEDGSIRIESNDEKLSVGPEGISIVGSITTKYTQVIGDGISKEFNIEHGLGTRDVLIQVVDTTNYDTVTVTTQRTSENSIKVEFLENPSEGQFKVIVIG